MTKSINNLISQCKTPRTPETDLLRYGSVLESVRTGFVVVEFLFRQKKQQTDRIRFNARAVAQMTHELILFAAAHFDGRKLSKRETKRECKVAYLLFVVNFILSSELAAGIASNSVTCCGSVGLDIFWSKLFYSVILFCPPGPRISLLTGSGPFLRRESGESGRLRFWLHLRFLDFWTTFHPRMARHDIAETPRGPLSRNIGERMDFGEPIRN